RGGTRQLPEVGRGPRAAPAGQLTGVHLHSLPIVLLAVMSQKEQRLEKFDLSPLFGVTIVDDARHLGIGSALVPSSNTGGPDLLNEPVLVDKQAISAIKFTLIVRPMITRTLLGPNQLGDTP